MEIIYMHTSKTSGKSYIGKTSKTVEQRLNEHFNHANNEKIKTTHFHKALLKYGLDDFDTVVLEETEDSSEREKFWIKHYDTLNNGYNMTAGGDGASGYKQTSEHKEKIRQANLGSKRSDDQKKNISDAHLGQVPWNKGTSEGAQHLHGEFVCPHCKKEGTSLGTMKMWHFDYCKENPNGLTRDKFKRPAKSEQMKESMQNMLTALDIRDNVRKLISKDDFDKYDYYVGNTTGKVYDKTECPHCNKLVAPQGKRWHFDKCKLKKENNE